MSVGRDRVAAFDVDGTITRRDCVVPFVRRASSLPRTIARMLARPHLLLAAGFHRDRDRMKELFTSAAFRDLDEAAVRSEAADFARDVYEGGLRDDVVARLRSHQSDGDTTVLVSASYEVYLQPLAELLGVDDVVATRLESREGVLTGDLVGVNCRGPEKVRRLHTWLDARPDLPNGRHGVFLTAYGDSSGDRELLADADDPHWVGTA